MEAHGNRGLLQTNPYKETLVNPDGMVRFDSAACTSFLRAVRIRPPQELEFRLEQVRQQVYISKNSVRKRQPLYLAELMHDCGRLIVVG